MLDLVQIGAEKAGGLGKLAAALGIRHQAFYSWRKVPAERVLSFERATGIPRHVIRPDLYGNDVPQDADRVMTAGAEAGLASAPTLSRQENTA
jgi:DNA-binding transcriptional regulator YdaS (Cro superfamily)